jgi:hypothetical protein
MQYKYLEKRISSRQLEIRCVDEHCRSIYLNLFVIVITRQLINLHVGMSHNFLYKFVPCRVAQPFLISLLLRRYSYIFIQKYTFCSIYVGVCQFSFSSRIVLAQFLFEREKNIDFWANHFCMFAFVIPHFNFCYFIVRKYCQTLEQLQSLYF